MCNFAEEEQATGGAIALCCFVALCSFDSKRNRQEGAFDFTLLPLILLDFLDLRLYFLDLSIFLDRRSSAVFSLQILWRRCIIGLIFACLLARQLQRKIQL